MSSRHRKGSVVAYYSEENEIKNLHGLKREMFNLIVRRTGCQKTLRGRSRLQEPRRRGHLVKH